MTMPPLILEIPTLYSNKRDFQKLARLCRRILKTSAQEIIVCFPDCRFFKASAVACLTAALKCARNQNKSVRIAFDTIQEDVYRACCNYGFLHYFGGPASGGSLNTITLRQFHVADRELINYLFNKVPDHKFFPHISTKLRTALCSRFVEIYMNAFVHSKSTVGAFSCGQGYSAWSLPFQLTVVDLGIGIPANVRYFLDQPGMTGERAIQWALQEGHSTKFARGTQRTSGLGLNLLSELAQLKDGKLEIYSHDGYACIRKSGIITNTFPENFPGTVLNLELKKDVNFYYLTEEAPNAI
jgi:hypothetical protein